MYLPKLGTHVPINEKFSLFIEEMKDNGFYSADLDLCTFWSEPEKEKEAYKTIEEKISRILNSGLKLNAVHISFGPNWDVCTLCEDERKSVVKKCEEIISRCDKFNPNAYVFHGSFEPIIPEEREKRLTQLSKSMKEIIEFTDTQICVETLPRSCLLNTSKETVKFVDSVKGLKVCLDVNHLLQEKSEDAVLALNSRIFTLHISDFDYVDECHFLPKEGKIDWMKLIGNLEKTGYNGVFNYEADTSLYTPKQVKENFDELFNEYNG